MSDHNATLEKPLFSQKIRRDDHSLNRQPVTSINKPCTIGKQNSLYEVLLAVDLTRAELHPVSLTRFFTLVEEYIRKKQMFLHYHQPWSPLQLAHAD